MKKHLVPAVAVLATIITATAAKNSSDPVLMTINNKDVPVSEFQYLFNKSNQQQAEPITLEQYVDMFVNYKLKVADAETAGIDTTAAFVKEFDGYCADLAKPYMTDSAAIDKMRREAYSHMLTNRDVSHIMVSPGTNPNEREANRALLDSIRTLIVNGADLGELAVKYSSDRGAMRNKGHMGPISAGKLPWPFEQAAYATAVGKISPVVDDAPYGFHIIRVEGETPNPGQVKVRHILKLTRGLSPEEVAVKRAEIDSLYKLAVAGADFAMLALEESDDPGSARQSGELPWFGPGEMVAPFEKASFALADGEVSPVVETSYGFHIIKKEGSRPVADYETVIPMLDRAIANDDRANESSRAFLTKTAADYKLKVNNKVRTKVLSAIERNGGLDAAMLSNLRADYTPIVTYKGGKVTLSDVAKAMPDYEMTLTPAAARTELDRTIDRVSKNQIAEAYRANLRKTNPSYNALVNEYRDGILLYEISNRNVWDRSNKDREGLEAYFNAHRGNYNWTAPHFKGIVISASNDSVADLANAIVADNLSLTPDSLAKNLRETLGRNVKIERKVVAQGDDAWVDHLMFGADKPANPGKWGAAFIYQGKVIAAPEEASDVRATVLNDYQQWLENAWLDELHKKYPVVINTKVLESLTK